MRIRVLRRKCFLFLLLMFVVGLQAMATESCGIVFNLHDSYGDGWNGNKLVVSDGNALHEELTFNNGSSASFMLVIAEGSHVTLSWIEGAFSDECSFSVQFENGYPIYESGNLSGTSYEFNLNCDDANTPVTITVASGNDEAGSVSGGGEFVCGEICTVTATPNEGYSFWCWVDEDENKAISTEANYTFTVSGPQVLLAAFRPVSNANNIVFADPNVENICLQQDWDTDNDGYLSYTEASAVTDLGGAFQWNPNITSFNELQYFTGLTSIGDQAFGGCSNLMSITLPNSVISIETNSFSACNGLEHIIVDTENPVYDSRDNCNAVIETSTNTLVVGCKNTNIPNTVTSIGDNAFANCTSLESITIPNSVTAIGDYAFVYCSSLTSVLIPNTVTSLGEAVFGACSDLEQITVEEGNPVYDSRDNCNAIIETSTNTLISGCQNTVIPNTVTSIGMEAFAANESLTAIAIPNSVTTIGDQAFVVCTNLTSLIIPSSVQSIGNSAFAGCTGLTSMIIFNTNVEMGDNVFDGVTVPEILFISANASPTDGGGLFGLSQGGGGSAFVGTLNDFSIEFAPQGSGEVPSNNPVLLMAKPNEGWQFVGWQINGELVSDEASLMFRAFGEFAFEAHFEPCGAEPEPELLSGRFSVSDCSTIGFARSNTIMSMTDLSDQSAMSLGLVLGVGIPGLHFEIGENQWDRMTYDTSALNGNSEAYEELLLTGVDIFPSFFIKNNIDCWHIPTWREWDYMLNQRQTTSGVRYAYAKVNDVCGLVVLPDDWNATTYAFSNPNEVAGYENNNITANQWTTVLEPAGAVFLPANGYMVQGQLIQETSDGQAVGAYPGLLFSPNGDFMMGQMEGFPMTGPMTLILDMMTMAGMMNSSSGGSFGGTSVRLVKAMDNSTATIVLATNNAERGTATGGGEFACQQECTVTATANDGYVFMYWLEDGVAISLDPVYSFKLLGDRNLTAVFASVDEVCQINIETTVPSGISFELEWFGVGLSLSFDDGTPPYNIPFGTSPESLDFLEILQLMQSMQSGNTNTNYTFTVNILRGSNVSLDVWMPEDMINLMMGSGGSISDLGLTFTVSYVDGATIVENSSELPYNFLCNCADITLLVDPEEGGAVEADGALYIGETVTLTAVANEHYSFINWTFNGVEMSTEPSFVFEVTEGGEMVAHFEAEHTYTVAVSVNPDESGTVSFFDSNNAPVDFEDSTIPNEWNNAISSYPWIIWNSNPHTGSYCMASSNYNENSSSSFIDATFEFVEDGSIEFYSRVSSESASFDWGSFYIDGVEQFREGGTSPNTWTLHHYEVTAGIHTFRWYYRKDGSVNSGEDRYFIDDIVFTGLSGGNVYYSGETCVLTATPAEGYEFVNWTENGEVVSTDAEYSFTVTNDRNLTANFSLNNYEITVAANIEEGGTVTGAGSYGHGSECTLTAIPSEGYAFSAWIENGEVIATDNPYTFTVTSERSLEASFIYLLPMIADDFNDGIINQQLWMATGTHVVEEDGQLKLQQNVTDNYTALESQPLSVPVDNKIVINREFILHEQLHNSSWGNHYFYGNVNVKLNGSNDNYIGVCYYDDDYENRHGTYIRTQLNGEVTETRICDAIFDAWLTETVILDLSNELLTYILGENLISTISIPNLSSQQLNYYRVRFKPDGWWTGHYHNMNYVNISTEPNAVYTITAQGTPIGAGQVYGGGDFSLAEACTLTAIPSEGYAFSAWIENGETVSTDAVYGFTVTGERSLVAVFLPTYVITAEANNADYGTVTGGGTFMDGETCSLTATPNDGFGFVAWTEDGETVSTDAIYNFTVTSERNLVAVFLPTYEIAIVANDENYGSVTGGGTYVLNESCMVTATPAEGYHFVNWTENGDEVSTDAEYTFTVTNSRDLVANFALNYYDITAEAEPEEGGTVMGAGTYGHGSECTLTATANYGYHFVNWTLDGSVVSTEPNYTFTVISAGDYTANFQLNNYAINASANPSEGGSVSGTGNYDHGTDCTLTATANVGYTFVNWTLDGTEVGTDPTYTFTVYGDATYVANFSLNLYEITAITNPVEGGTITGAGNYYHGSGCTLTATPNEGYTFLYWNENGNYLSSDAIYSFVATSDRSLVAVFAGNEQTMSLSPGWTWLSSYIEMEDNDGLGMLENGLDPNGVMIKSQRDGFVSYANEMWMGTLENITNEKMYLVNTNEASNVNFTGPVAQLNAHPITLNPNWTWLGYPVPFVVDINEALANLNASENDVVKSQSTFATYSTNDGWSGSLNQLTPGMGLMYQSHNSQPVTFNYGVGMSRALKANVTAEHNHWVPDIHAYPNNMSVMAVVELNGEELQDEGYELAVFNGSECRGSARLAYVPSLHRYVAFLTVTGEDDVELYLALYDTMTGKAYYNTTDCPNFEANAVLGSLSMPFVARFGGATDVEEWNAPNIELYPNPVVAGHLFQMEMPAECQGARVSIVNALGAVISTTDVYDEPVTLRAPAVPGVYMVRIVTDKQGTFTRKLIVNK